MARSIVARMPFGRTAPKGNPVTKSIRKCVTPRARRDTLERFGVNPERKAVEPIDLSNLQWERMLLDILAVN